MILIIYSKYLLLVQTRGGRVAHGPGPGRKPGPGWMERGREGPMAVTAHHGRVMAHGVRELVRLVSSETEQRSSH